MSSFRERHTEEDRKRERERIQARYPSYVPAILQPGGRDAPSLQKEKFLIPREITAGQFQYLIRKRLRLHSSEALFLLCGGVVLSGTDRMSSVYDSCVDGGDGFLYITYTRENTFG